MSSESLEMEDEIWGIRREITLPFSRFVLGVRCFMEEWAVVHRWD